MAGSPTSPRRGYAQSPSMTSSHDYPPLVSHAGYSSPGLLDFQYQAQSPFQSVDTSPMPEGFPPASWKPHRTDTSQPIWNVPARSNSASSSIGSIASHDYEAFAGYEACLSTPSQGLLPPYPASVALSRTPSSSTSVAEPVSGPSRRTMTYTQDHSDLRSAMGDASGYSTALEASASSFPAPVGMHTAYPGTRAAFSSSPQAFILDDVDFPWPRQPHAAGQPYNETPPRSSGASHAAQQPEGSGRPRRATRKHTTKEEANYQCDVEGCGKFFSRSYNYKSHMETHDEGREYPFPCPVEGCTKKFVRKTDLQRHHQSVHMRERNHKCDYCGRLFARKDTLRRHMDDGCPRRFDIGTLDMKSDDYKGVDMAEQASPPPHASGFHSNPDSQSPAAKNARSAMYR